MKRYEHRVSTCPRRDHHGENVALCPLCGASGPAYRFGYRAAPFVVSILLAAVVVACVALLAGCSAQPATPEDRFHASVRESVQENGFAYTPDLEESAYALGLATCRDLEEGTPMADIRAAVVQQTPEGTAVVQATITAAALHLCPGASK